VKCDIDRISFPLHAGGRERRLEVFANDVIPQISGR